MLLLLLGACAPTATDTAILGDRIDGVCINELMPSNRSAWSTAGEQPDWIELHNPSDTPLSLAGWSISDDLDAPDKHPFADDTVLAPGAFQLLAADGTGQPGELEHLGFKLSGDGELVALFDPFGGSSIVRFPATESDFSWARDQDCCSGQDCWSPVWLGTPGETNKAAGPLESQVLVPQGSVWAYLDQGVPPDNWRRPGGAPDWPTGPAPLGYGDAHQVTTLDYGADPNNKPMAAWFRLEFDAQDTASVQALDLSLLRDDGAVVWLNGQELLRSNLPAGELSPQTAALSAIGGDGETSFTTFPVQQALVDGTNVLAVELHQHAPNSSDLGFDLSLSVWR